ncbi:uncharacterized protein LOC128551660 [Mercenaria mercenaria]|uniref:uncharacterized protein LOC128551660 n=1 Tax=Mercenaria mercenaria TaxID=6596 RepID=UPI00234F5525|nr:uncharacterized protein LOC128551660 [Mercenaria mercenaria]
MDYYRRCLLCNKRCKPKDRIPINGESNTDFRKFLEKTFLIYLQSDTTDVTCRKCRQKFYFKHRNNVKPTPSPTPLESVDAINTMENNPSKMARIESENDIISLPLKSTGYTHSRCFICEKPGPKLMRVKSFARNQLFVETGVLLSNGARCCPRHLIENMFTASSITNVKGNGNVRNRTNLSSSELIDLIENIRKIATENKEKKLCFDDDSLSSDEYLNLTGLIKPDFDEMVQYVNKSKVSGKKSIRTTLAIFLTKIKTGLSNRIISTLYNLSKSQIRRSVTSIRKQLAKNVAPLYIGFSHISRSDVIEKHTRPLAVSLLGQNECSPPAILGLDGTYVYIHKSSYLKFQRKTYSVHKKRPLVKPMTSGYIVSVLGPYLANGKNNDANILNSILEQNVEEMKTWVRRGDVFVVDRGFKDSLGVLKDIGIEAKMPSFLEKGKTQHTTEDANESRLVTKIRWVVESANARIKQWQILNNVLPTSQLPYLTDYVRIICAICNKFKPPLSQTKDRLADIELGTKMFEIAKRKNELQNTVEEKLQSRTKQKWREVTESAVIDFPKLSEEQVRGITLGLYTVKLAKSYTAEHMSDDTYALSVCSDVPGILQARLQSRHTSAVKYKCWIGYYSKKISSWYCKCKAGARAVGSCAHVASVVWYLGTSRYLSNKWPTGWDNFVSDASKQEE